jgi:uncharacterized protein (DUF488 family)
MSNVATILTLGYEQRDLPGYIRLLRRARVGVVLDVRETAWSHKPGFSKTKLAEGLGKAGIRYVHAAVAGNPKALRRQAQSHADCLAGFERHLDRNPRIEVEFDALIGECLQREERVCLLCFERHPGDCHRGILVDRWARRHGGQAEHLAPDGCRRLVRELAQL